MCLFNADLHGRVERRFHLRLFLLDACVPPPTTTATVRLFESDFVNSSSRIKNVWIYGRVQGDWTPAVSQGRGGGGVMRIQSRK